MQTEDAPARAELARLFPELRQQPGFEEPPPPAEDPEAAQFRLFDAYATFVRANVERSPTVMVIEDLHWADRPTLKLFQHLAPDIASLPLLVVGTYRDTDFDGKHPIAETLAELNRESTFTRISLARLSEREVAEYLTAVHGSAPSPALVSQLHEETDGNPFFLAEMLKLLAAEGTLDKETLALVTEHNEDVLLRLIEEALDDHIVEETEGPERYRFTHALMQETLLDGLSTRRSELLHGRVGEALEQRYGETVSTNRQHASPSTSWRAQALAPSMQRRRFVIPARRARRLWTGLPGTRPRTTLSMPWSRSNQSVA